MEKIDVAIVGGGIVGLWVANELIRKKPNWSIALFEKESFLGEHSTGRNSEVLHAGLYYDYGSVKHQTCLRGNILWREFCQRYGVGFLDCGKFIVANSAQGQQLDDLYYKAQINMVPGLRKMTSSECSELSHCVNVNAGFFSPTSGVLDVSSAVKVLAHEFEQAGGLIFRSSRFTVLSRDQAGFVFQVSQDQMSAQILINCAGHGAVELREQLGLHGYVNRWVKGHYLTLKNNLPLKNLIYPIPPAHGLGLGVHLTLDVAGRQKFGPNTKDVDRIDYAVDEDVLHEMYDAVVELFPTVKKDMLSLGYSGIRTKIINSSKQLLKDFVVGSESNHGVANYFEFLGIESPGVTSSPALAEKLVAMIL